MANFTGLDATASSKTFKSTTNAGVETPHVNVDAVTSITNVVQVGDNSTTLSIDDGGSSITIDGSVTPAGDVAHDAADSGNPVKVGAKAIATLSGTTLVAAADRTNNQSDLDGALIVRPHYALGDLVSGSATNTDGTSTSVISAAGSGIKVYITDVIIFNSSVTTVYVELKDGSTSKAYLPVPAGSGVVKTFASPIGGTANTAWNLDSSAAVSTLYYTLSGFKSKI